VNFLTCSEELACEQEHCRLHFTTYHVRAKTHVSLTSVHDTLRQRLAATTLANRKSLHVLLQIHVQVLEDEVKLVAVGVDNVEEADNVRVVHFLEKRDLANGSGRDTLILGFETDLLEGDNALIGSAQVEGFVNNTVRACEGK
jgi:hypothetical protein